jgi:hypothetical protein
MSTDFRRGNVVFDPTAGQIQTQTGAVVFDSPVVRAEVAISAFDIRYDDSDHHVLREMIGAEVQNIDDATVFYQVQFLLRDDSGDIDDPFSGSVDVLVMAQLADRTIGVVERLLTVER